MQVKYALDNLPLELSPQHPVVGQKGLSGKCGLTEPQADLLQRFDPVGCDTIGFFIAKFIKTA